MVDYRQFKTPFFNIKIYDSRGQRGVELPHHILKLVSKIDITETLEPNTMSTMTIQFVEGSREPASPDKNLGTRGLYKIESPGTGRVDMNISGSLTNRPGVITDLRFSGSSGITFLTESEKVSGKISSVIQDNVEGEDSTRTHKGEPKTPTFLFQERNQVEVEWGYLEDLKKKRKIRLYIAIVEVNYPDSGQITTTITCQSTKALLDQVAPVKGVTFGEVTKTVGNNKVASISDKKTAALLKEICENAGIDCIISENLPNERLDKTHQKIWVAGESFTQFIDRLAKETNSVVDVRPNPKTGKDTLLFISRKEIEKKVRIKDKNLLAYKLPGSILKSVRIKADFGGLGGSAKVGVNEDGELQSNATHDPQEELQQFDSGVKKTNSPKTKSTEQLMPWSPANPGNNDILACTEIGNFYLDGTFTTHSEILATDNDKSRYKDSANVESDQNSRILVLDFTTIGYTKLTPGVYEFDNIGVRYSGKYRVLNVTHSISSSGYTCTGTAKSHSINKGGVKPVSVNHGEELEADSKESLQQFNPAKQPRDLSETSVNTGASTVVSSDTIDKYHNFQGT